jgi:P-type Cu+ transporter
VGEFSADEVLRLAACAEHDSEHPLADAIREEARSRALRIAPPATFEALEGAGVRANVEGAEVAVGSAHHLAVAAGAGKAGAGPQRMEATATEGATLVHVWRDGCTIGHITLSDQLRPDVAAALDAVRRLGVHRIEMLTGDSREAAAPMAAALGVEVRAGLLPQDKLRIVREHQAAGRTVAMVGDGVNDAPALAAADIGIVLGATATDLALEVADVALMRDEWGLVPDAFATARRTMRVVRGNFGFTGLYNVVGLTLAALGILPPMLAAAAQSIPDIGILGNSARLFRR